MRQCWTRQTGTFEGRVSNDVWVQVPFAAPKRKVANATFLFLTWFFFDAKRHYEEVSSLRKRIYEIIAVSDGNDIFSSIYDYFMMIAIVASLIPLAFKTDYFAFRVIDKICVVIFIADYILRLATADYKYNKKSVTSFLKYPFSFMAIIDLISILPSVTALNGGFKVLRVMRMVRALRVLRVFKAARYSKSIQIIARVFHNSKAPLAAVGTLAIGYVLISALVIINVEPDSFNNFFDAVYWATVSLTTMGYGDIYPVTTVGRFVTMLSSVFGIAIVALPSGIITAGYMTEIEKANNQQETNNLTGETDDK